MKAETFLQMVKHCMKQIDLKILKIKSLKLIKRSYEIAGIMMVECDIIYIYTFLFPNYGLANI